MKLSMKTVEQKQYLTNYFAEKQSDWTRDEIKALSERIQLSCKAVKKWLWDRREKNSKLLAKNNKKLQLESANKGKEIFVVTKLKRSSLCSNS